MIRPLDDLLDTTKAIVGGEQHGIGLTLRGRDSIINALMASPPGHPLWLDVMDGMVRAYRPRRILERHTSHVIRMAIAILDDHAESRFRRHGDVVILPPKAFYPSCPRSGFPNIAGVLPLSRAPTASITTKTPGGRRWTD